MHIEVSGYGPALVLIHGWALHGGIFEPLAEQLRPHFQLHIVDLPGHGYSRPAAPSLELERVVAEIAAATPPAVWCGWSMGGLYALQAALTQPQVRGVAMVASLPRFVRGQEWPNAVDPAVFAQFGQDLARDYDGTLGRFLALDVMGDPQAMARLSSMREHLVARGSPDPAVLAQGLELLAHTDLRAALATLTKPGLWLAGRRDRLVPAGAVHAAAALSPAHHTALTLPGAHAPFLGDPTQVAEPLRQFVAALG